MRRRLVWIQGAGNTISHNAIIGGATFGAELNVFPNPYIVYWRYADSMSWNTIVSDQPITWAQETKPKSVTPPPGSDCQPYYLTAYVYWSTNAPTKTSPRINITTGVNTIAIRVPIQYTPPYIVTTPTGITYPMFDIYQSGRFGACNLLAYKVDWGAQQASYNATIDDWVLYIWPANTGTTPPTECVTTFSTGDVITADKCIIVTETPPD